jgi:hypothetical protein
MIDLHVHFGSSVEASILFSSSTAVRMKPITNTNIVPFDQKLSLRDAIEQLSHLREQVGEFAGRLPDKLTVYRPAKIFPELIERLDKASFGAGFGSCEFFGHMDIASALLAKPIGRQLLLIHASKESLGGTAFSADMPVGLTTRQEASVKIDTNILERSILQLVSRGSGLPQTLATILTQELIERYWSLDTGEWTLEARAWQPAGWSAVTIDSTDAATIDAIVIQPLRELLGAVVPLQGDTDVAIIGEGARRLAAIVETLSLNMRIIKPISTNIVDAMIAISRSRSPFDFMTDASRQPGSSSEVNIVFDPRTEITADINQIVRESRALKFRLAMNKLDRLDQVPAKWNRSGFELNATIDGSEAQVLLFGKEMKTAPITFSVLAESRRVDKNTLLVRLTVPQLKSACLVNFRAGQDPGVEYFSPILS